jgi:hypothetical protein
MRNHITQRCCDPFGIVLQVAYAEIAISAQKATHLAGLVTVVDHEAPLAWVEAATGADPTLGGTHGGVFSGGQAVMVTSIEILCAFWVSISPRPRFRAITWFADSHKPVPAGLAFVEFRDMFKSLAARAPLVAI